MERDDEEVLHECTCGCREAGFAFASLAALPPPPQSPTDTAPWRAPAPR